MHQLEQRIAGWRNRLNSTPGVSPKTADELECHLREDISALLRSGMNETEAYQKAVVQLGATPILAAEFQKLELATWLPAKVITGLGAIMAVLLLATLIPKFHNLPLGYLLICHIFTTTLGYLAALLTGILGMCYAWERCQAGFTPPSESVLVRTTFRFSLLAACLTGTGIVLGTFWSRTKLGHWWQWEVKETTALGVLIWLVLFLMIHSWRGISARALLVLSIFGNLVVTTAWFGPFTFGAGNLGSSPAFTNSVMAVLIVQFAFLLAGLAPAGWLRFHLTRKA